MPSRPHHWGRACRCIPDHSITSSSFQIASPLYPCYASGHGLSKVCKNGKQAWEVLDVLMAATHPHGMAQPKTLHDDLVNSTCMTSNKHHETRPVFPNLNCVATGGSRVTMSSSSLDVHSCRAAHPVYPLPMVSACTAIVTSRQDRSVQPAPCRHGLVIRASCGGIMPISCQL